MTTTSEGAKEIPEGMILHSDGDSTYMSYADRRHEIVGRGHIWRDKTATGAQLNGQRAESGGQVTLAA